ncbi:MAG: hypothetical protein IJU18_07820, partial [Oscillospiraceae bacterium]|nr:hypothetical protein [Oscillospiraceae bacterium]
VVSKDARGYFVPTPFTAKATMRQLEEEGFVQVLHVNGSADCYLTTLIPYGFVDNDLANASESAGEMDGIKYLLVPYSSALQVYVYTDRSDNEAIQKVIAPLFEEYFR